MDNEGEKGGVVDPEYYFTGFKSGQGNGRWVGQIMRPSDGTCRVNVIVERHVSPDGWVSDEEVARLCSMVRVEVPGTGGESDPPFMQGPAVGVVTVEMLEGMVRAVTRAADVIERMNEILDRGIEKK
jgi:hypothetical protein